MIRILVILIVISPMFGFAQTETHSEIELVGIWVLTDFDNPKKFSDTWEFRSDSIFNELKYKADGDTTLTIDAHGKWKLVGNNLTISIWGEDDNGEQRLYNQPQKMKFLVNNKGSFIMLDIIENGGANNGETIKLKLSKK